MKNSKRIGILALFLVGAPLCAITQNDTEVTTKVTKKTPYKKETHKTVAKTKAGAHKPTTVTSKTETVKKSPTTQTRAQKLHTSAKNSEKTTVKTVKTEAYSAPLTAAPLLAGAAVAAQEGSLRAQANHKAFKDNSVVYALEQHPQASTFTGRLKQHHVLSKLSGKGEYTIFAPINEAFEHGKHLTDAKLEEHIVPGNFDTQALRRNKGALKTLSNGTLTIQEKDGHLYANNAELVGHGVKTKNGQIHFVKNIITQ
jgi:uncharacterized surface protein with fasciclin (FAS1) repeats